MMASLERRFGATDRARLLDGLWREYYAAQGRTGPAEGEADIAMEDCEVFECGVASFGRKAYGFMKKLNEDEVGLEGHLTAPAIS